MKNKFSFLLAAAALLLFINGCKHSESTENSVTVSPEAGTSYKSGDQVVVKAHFPNDLKPDSVVYLLDSVKVGSAKDSSAITLKTDSMHLGARIITAKVYQGGKSQEGSTNIVLLPAKAPALYM